MLRIVSALDLFEPDPIDRTRRRHAARFYLDDRGHAWRAVRRRTQWGRAEAPAPGEFYGLDGALHKMSRLRDWYREPSQTDAAQQRAHLARWRLVRATARRGRETVERFDVLERESLPSLDPDAWPPSELRPAGLDGWTLTDDTDAARAREAENRTHAARWRWAQTRAYHFGTADWNDRDGLLKLVRPSRTTRTATAHYVERAGRWTRTEDPARVWRRRDTVEVVLRLNDPRLAAALYKRRGRVETFHQRLVCRVWTATDTVLDSGRAHRAVRAPAQQAAALRRLLDRARRDLAPEVEAERRRKRDRAAQRRARKDADSTDDFCQLALF